MKCWISPYELESADALNSRTERRRYRGALIREGSGFGCLHPWLELGDPSLEECLADLAGKRGLRLVRRAIDCVELDGRAREEGRSLFEGVEVPESHYLMQGLSEEELVEAVERGFSVLKVKCGKEVAGEMERVKRLGRVCPGMRWRIDFNESAMMRELREILSFWGREELSRIDFLEDPSPFDPDDWRGFPVSLANDREMARDDGSSDVLVVKPAVEKIPYSSSQRVVVTSYLDHPLGQCFAAYEAGRAGVREVCGLQSHGMYLPSEFGDKLGRVEPEFQSPGGLGLGFDELLEALNWHELLS